MKTVKAICTAAILALALSIPAYAGDIGSPGITAPEDAGSPGAESEGDMSTRGFVDLLMTLLFLV